MKLILLVVTLMNKIKGYPLWWLICTAIAVILAALLMVLLALAVRFAYAENVGQVPQDVLDNPRSMEWFRQPRIAQCCSVADGYPTEWEFNQASNHYRIPSRNDPKAWIDVPDGAVVTQDAMGNRVGNPTGYAWVWWYSAPNPDGSFGIRCFVPNGGA